MQLINNPLGNYRFLRGIAPFSFGVVAMAGYEIIQVTLHQPLPYRQGFEWVDQHLSEVGRSRQALCAIALRSPKPFTVAGFKTFNEGYQTILAEWGLLVEGVNPIARTNIAPEVEPPDEPSLYAFSYTTPTDQPQQPTFVVSGGADNRGREIVRQGETSVDALREKAAQVMSTMQARLTGLQTDWSHVTAIDIYTVFPVQPYLAPVILESVGSAAIHSVHWYYGRPPIMGLDFEMDVRGVRQEIRLAGGDESIGQKYG